MLSTQSCSIDIFSYQHTLPRIQPLLPLEAPSVGCISRFRMHRTSCRPSSLHGGMANHCYMEPHGGRTPPPAPNGGCPQARQSAHRTQPSPWESGGLRHIFFQKNFFLPFFYLPQSLRDLLFFSLRRRMIILPLAKRLWHTLHMC